MLVIEKDKHNRIYRLLEQQTVYQWNDGIKEVDAKFYHEDENFYYFLDGVIDNDAIRDTGGITIPPHSTTTTGKLVNNSKLKLRDYQVEIKEFLLRRFKRPVPQRLLVDLQTGKGKTLIACNTLVKHNRRFALVILSRYTDKWLSDLMKNIKLREEDIYIVKGSTSLIDLMLMKPKDMPKVVMFSNRTLSVAMSAMVKGIYSEKYPMPLHELLAHLDVDTLLLDEVHQHFNSIYLSTMMLNPQNVLGLSATFHTDSVGTKQHYLDFFKPANRISPLTDEKYRNVISVEYRLSNQYGMNFKNWFTKSYTHTTFEQAVFKYPRVLQAYLDFVAYQVDKYYIKRTDEPQGKLLIFAGTEVMIVRIVENLRKLYPSFDIRKYMARDPYQNILDADIIVSTIGSSGTALDIDKLTTVINTVSMLSSNANIQAYGRLREIPNSEIYFIYLWCLDIPSHIAHHRAKTGLYASSTKQWTLDEYHVDISPNRF